MKFDESDPKAFNLVLLRMSVVPPVPRWQVPVRGSSGVWAAEELSGADSGRHFPMPAYRGPALAGAGRPAPAEWRRRS
ncbi:jg15755 [Pararge aegeria aegeria]|uniref:Jg15755 protein n=1 Tax=Pararge aegeria aegeria TaxID=348720 RepID=A0A8S4RJ35_9NEOP|nr:jg15755 [Pararge aegeria aegeria]